MLLSERADIPSDGDEQLRKDEMAICKFCGSQFNWGRDDSLDKPWVKLVPIGADVGMDRTHQDENGVLRAQHTCAGWTAAVEVTKLQTPISAGDIIGQAAVEMSAEKPKQSRKRRSGTRDMYEDTIPFGR